MSFIITGLNVLGFAIPIVFDILLLFDSLIYSIAAYLLQAFFEIASFNINSNSINGTKVVEEKEVDCESFKISNNVQSNGSRWSICFI